MTTETKTPLRDRARQKLEELKQQALALAAEPNMLDFDDTTGEIWLETEVGSWGATAKHFRDALRAIGDKPVTLYLNSPGGSVSEGLAIYSLLSEHEPGVNTTVTGVAASMASAIFQVGAKRMMMKNSLLMVHSPWTQHSGNASQMEKEAEILRKHEDSLVGIYASRSGMSVDEVKKLMAAETWMSDAESVAAGFADGIIGASARKTMTVAEARRRVDAVVKKYDRPAFGTIAWARAKLLKSKIADMRSNLALQDELERLYPIQ